MRPKRASRNDVACQWWGACPACGAVRDAAWSAPGVQQKACAEHREWHETRRELLEAPLGQLHAFSPWVALRPFRQKMGNSPEPWASVGAPLRQTCMSLLYCPIILLARSSQYESCRDDPVVGSFEFGVHLLSNAEALKYCKHNGPICTFAVTPMLLLVSKPAMTSDRPCEKRLL